MYEKLDSVKLKTGETMEIGIVTAPDGEFTESIENLLAHKGETWRSHIHAALAGETDQLETRFYLGLLDGQPVGNIMTVERHGVGILGHVYTLPEQRRKGICQAIMERQMEHFRQRGGKTLTLGTGFDSPPYWIYHSFGFRSLTGGFMRYSTEPDYDFEDRWFSPGPAAVVPMEWRHGPLVSLMAALPGKEFLRSVRWRVFGIGNLEGSLLAFRYEQERDPSIQAVVLETPQGAVTGCATVFPQGGWPGVWLADVFTHPHFADRAADLINGLPLPAGKTVMYVDTGAPDKAASLESCGFTREGTLKGHLRVGDNPHDVWIYGKES